jgi:hypothetical protein
MSTLRGVMMLVTEDLEEGYNVGYPCMDSSLELSDPDRTFYCRCVLLFLCGDYPALGKLTGFSHQGEHGCHWCQASFPKDMALHVHVHNNHRLYLSSDHQARSSVGFAAPETRRPPRARTHNASIRSVLLKPGALGLTYDCPLYHLPCFNLVNDVLPDMMHCNHYIKSTLLPVLKGSKLPAPPTLFAVNLRRKVSAQESKQRARENRSRTLRHGYCLDRLAVYKLEQSTLDNCDAKLAATLGASADKSIFRKPSSMKSKDWLDFVQFHEPYVMFGALDGKAASDWNMLLDAFRQLIEAVFTADSMSDEEADREEARLSDKVCHAFANMHSWPDVVFTPISHMYVHFARPIRTWGCVRNFWAFFNERFVGWITNFIADRARPTENIVDAYSGYTHFYRVYTFVVRVYMLPVRV